MTPKAYLKEVEDRAERAQENTFVARAVCRTDIPLLCAMLREAVETIDSIGEGRGWVKGEEPSEVLQARDSLSRIEAMVTERTQR